MKKNRARFLRAGIPWRRFFVAFLLPLILIMGVIYFLITAYAIYTVIHPPMSVENMDPSAYFLKFQDFSYKSGKGNPLPAWYIPSKPESPVLLLLPGYGENRIRSLSLADKLHAAGFTIVLPLLRGHQRQSSEATTLGWLESEDLESLLSELKGRKFLEAQKLGAWGMNTSAYALLRTAYQGVPFCALVLDSPYVSIEDGLLYRLNQYAGDRNVFLPSLTVHLFGLLTILDPLKTPPPLTLQPWRNPPSLYLIVQQRGPLPVQRAIQALESLPHTQTWKLAATREEELGGPSQDNYDQGVVQFFQKVDWKKNPH